VLGDSFALATADHLGATLLVGGDDDYDESWTYQSSGSATARDDQGTATAIMNIDYWT